MRATSGSGAFAVSSSDGFYVDTSPPEFDQQIMSLDIYYDVDQGESTPVRYQQSNSTIKAIWKCDDEESDIVVSCLCLVSYGSNKDWLRLAQNARYIFSNAY